MSEDKLKAFGSYIQRVINKEQLSREETRSLFIEILENKQPDLQQGALLAALVSKGETAREIAGAWEAINTYDTCLLYTSPSPRDGLLSRMPSSA